MIIFVIDLILAEATGKSKIQITSKSTCWNNRCVLTIGIVVTICVLQSNLWPDCTISPRSSHAIFPALEVELGPAADYRICKGIYLEPEDIAYTGYLDIVDSTNACIDRMLSAGSYCSIASHDLPVVDYALEALTSHGMGPGIPDPRSNAGPQRDAKGPGYEFQMLLGVRGPLRRKLAKDGHRTRVYIPYGEKWYEYSIRRLKENPTVGAQVAKAFLMPWTNRP